MTSRRPFLIQCGAAVLGGVGWQELLAQQPPGVAAIDERIRQLALDAPLAMQFRGQSSEQCRQWQAEFATQLRTLLGPHQPPKSWQTIVENRVELEDHVREELVLVADGHPPLPVYLLIPKEAHHKPRAGVLAIHGHGAYGYDPVAGRDEVVGVAQVIADANYDYGRQLVRRGYVVAVPCLTPFGRRLGDGEAYKTEDPCAVTFVRLQLLGKVLMAENLRDCLWAIELLAQHKQVDADRLGCVGLSYGGRMTMLTAALEPRIRVAAVSGALNVMQERILGRFSCGAQIIPGLLNYGDVPEIGSLIAPRPCVWEIGSRDGLISQQWADEAIQRMNHAYRAYDAQDNLLVDRFEGGHRFNGHTALALIEKTLGI